MIELLPLKIPQSEGKPFIIAGPCAAETEEQVMCTAQALAKHGVKIMRAGVWKPRTKPGCFEGCGVPALQWLKEAKEATGMLTSTEVATPEHVEEALKYGIDILWVGARTTTNPFAVQALADCLKGTDVTLLVKNPISPDLDLWIGAFERFNKAGIKRLGAIHRGFFSYGETIYRNSPMWQIPIELRRRIPELPICCDPSHMGGAKHLIAPLAQQALDMGGDGLMIECHCNPEKALSDAQQQLLPDELAGIISALNIRQSSCPTDEIKKLRIQIDELDNNLIDLLSKRMQICREIGSYKKNNNITILQTDRYNEILDMRENQGKGLNMSSDFIRSIFEHIHEESIRQQIKVFRK